MDMCLKLKNEGFKDTYTMYPYVNIALRMYLFIFNVVQYQIVLQSDFYYFIALKRIKCYLRSRMTDEQLNSLPIDIKY